MDDWMLVAFLGFFGAALILFVVALKRGLLTHMEEAKYYLLQVEEPDFYTPQWIKEMEDHASLR